MIEIKNNGDKVKIEELYENTYKVILNKEDGLLIPSKSSVKFDTDIKLSFTHKSELIFIEGNSVSHLGCFIEDAIASICPIEKMDKLVLEIENLSNEDITIPYGKGLAILYKFFRYDENKDFNVVYRKDNIAVSYLNNGEQEYIADNINVTTIDGVIKVSMDIVSEPKQDD